MKSGYFFFTLILILSSLHNVNAQSLSWVKTTGNSGFNEINPYSTAIDAAKNVLVTGSFSGTFDFNPNAGVSNLSTIAGASDIFVQKLDSNGNFTWAISLAGSGYNNANSIQTDAAGNIYIVGSFNSPVDFDPGVAVNTVIPYGNQDAFILKLNAAGDAQWVHHFGANLVNAGAQSMAIDNNNDIILSGFFQDSVDFDPGSGVANLNATGWATQFILKLNSSGSYIFAKALSGTDYSDSKGISIDALNNICLTGTFYGTIDFDPGAATYPLTSNNSEDIYLLKLNSSGNFSWAYLLGNDGYESVAGIANDNAGNVYLTGSFSDSIDMNPGTAVAMHYSTGNSDMMVLKVSPSGSYHWGHHFGGFSNEQVKSIDVDNYNHVYLTGQFEDVVDFDPNTSTHQLVSNGLSDVFILSLDENGLYRMAKNVGAVSDDKGVNVVVDNSNNLFCTGLFKDTVDFDPTAAIVNEAAFSTFNQGDVFTFKWDLCPTASSSIIAYDCNSVLFNGNTYTSSGTYTEVLNSVSGCDSLVTLNITIGNNNSIINHTQCAGGPFVFNGVSYTIAGTYVQNFTNAAGCDSNYTINLSFGTPSSYLITDTACDVYFFGSQILFSTGTYTNVLTNASGCDSTVYLHLTIKHSSYTSVSVSSCGPYNFNGTVYSSSGLYTGIFPAANGCDSSVDLDLLVIITSSSTQTATACNSYTYNGQTFTSSGAYLDTFTNMFGCDSIVTLNLTITSPITTITQTGVTLSVITTPLATYQWINCTTGNTPIVGATSTNYTATMNGDYAVIVTLNGCSDTSLCKNVTGVGTEDLNRENGLTIYPNPVRDNLLIDLRNVIAEFEISISNVVGQEVYQNKYHQINHLEIATSSWASGCYILTLKQGDRKRFYQLIKE